MLHFTPIKFHTHCGCREATCHYFSEIFFIGCSNKRTTNILFVQRKVPKIYYCLSLILSSEFRSSKTAGFFTTSLESNQRVEFLAVLNAMERVPNVDVFKMKYLPSIFNCLLIFCQVSDSAECSKGVSISIREGLWTLSCKNKDNVWALQPDLAFSPI